MYIFVYMIMYIDIHYYVYDMCECVIMYIYINSYENNSKQD